MEPKPRPVRPVPYVLVVDDDPLVREVISLLLTDEGYRTVEAANGLEALEQVGHEVPDLVLLDAQMPRMDGRTFVAALGECRVQVPIVLLSVVDDVCRCAPEVGVVGALCKPFEVDTLLELVASLVGAPGQ